MSPAAESTTNTPSYLSNATDRLALISFKSMLSSTDPGGLLVSWNDSVHFCRWSGVTCGDGLHAQRVISLELRSSNLVGSVSPAVSNLTFLRKIDLSDNQIRGPIPPEIGSLVQLQHLNLSVNSLEAGIPASLAYCSNLQVICMDRNMLQGEIPAILSSCVYLRIISLRRNELTGHIPPSLTNLSSLSVLSIGDNKLSGGIPPKIKKLGSLTVLDLSGNQLSGGIPASLGKLSKLTKLDLSGNHLSGYIPTTLWNLSSLSHLSVASNNLSGSIPSNAGHALPLLERVYLHNNRFHGPVPTSLPNASRLEIIDLSSNRLNGTIPANIGRLQNLRWLNLGYNQLEVREPDGWGFLTAMSNCTNLEKLELDSNNLGSILPNSIANFSTKLQKLTMSGNEISGSISPEVGNLVGLTTLDMGRNLLEGPIPASIGTLKRMHALDLGTNKLSGDVPSALGNLTQLNSLCLESNELSGTIPSTLGHCQNLILLDLSFNRFTGDIPKEILTISTLSLYLGLAHNSLTGSIPSEVGSLINLGKIDFSMNKLTGELPSSLSKCQELGKVFLNGNFFHGTISSLSTLRGMQELDLSINNLSGKIPYPLQQFPFLYHINLSFNNFDGEVQQHGVFANLSAASVIGNTNLCGGNPTLHLPPCSFQPSGKTYRFIALVVIFSFAFTVICLYLLFNLTDRCLCSASNERKSGRMWGMESIFRYHPLFRLPGGRISYAQLMRATNGFSRDNLTGVGSFGAVYTGILRNDSTFGELTFAVKVFHLQQRGASKSFMTECDILRNVRHRNILKIHTSCSSVDSMGNDFKAIVYQFMANGSLDNWLHPLANEQCEPKRLNFRHRVDIIMDVASALDYLHHNDQKPIVHCDIKPSNILLDDRMNACVSDFGLARFPSETLIRSARTITSVGFRGTLGYVAPEYGTANRVSTKGDVYSFGILVLEMFTGKRPTDDSFRRGVTLRKYVETAFPERVNDVIDASLFSDASYYEQQCIADCVPMLIRIALACSSELPAHRPAMGVVIKPLRAVRDAFIRRDSAWLRSA